MNLPRILGATCALVLIYAAAGCSAQTIREVPAPRNWTSPQVTRFVAHPDVVRLGQKALLTWNVRNVSQVLLEEAQEGDRRSPQRYLHSLGEFPANGSLWVEPKATTTYVISCGPADERGYGCVSVSVRVVVQ